MMKRFAAGAFTLLVLAFFFQNCGKAGFENQDLLTETSAASEIDVKLSKLPFPYDVSVNQIAHMTCPISSSGAPTGPYFSWAVGAFDNPTDVPSSTLGIRASGLQLSQKFLTEWNKVATTYNASVRPAKLKEALMGLPSVANSQLQLSLRKTNLPRTGLMSLPNGGDSPAVSFMPMITTDAIASPFVETPAAVLNFFPAAKDYSSRSLEAALNVPSAYGAYDVALRANYDSSFLTVGFLLPTEGGTGMELSAPSTTDDRYAYGKGYRIHFGTTNPHAGTTLYPTADSLSVVEEYDLESGMRTGAGWDCSLRFKIVQKADRYKPAYRANHFTMVNGACPTKQVTNSYCPSPVDARFGINSAYFPNNICPGNTAPIANTPHCEEQYSAACPEEPYNADLANENPIFRNDGVYHPSYPERPAILHALRRFLPASHWDVNVSRRCIVPKNDDNTCYQSSPVVYDEYFFSGGYANPTIGRYAGCGVAGQYACAAYLTVCLRK